MELTRNGIVCQKILALNRAFVWGPFQGELGKLGGAFSFCSHGAQVPKEAQYIEGDNGIFIRSCLRAILCTSPKVREWNE
jgi:hypothetical protein